MRTSHVIPLAMLVAVAACRDGVAPYQGTDRPPIVGDLRQLTYNPSHDLNPTWSSNSDTVYYTALGFYDTNSSQLAVMLKQLISGGIATLVAPQAQSTQSETTLMLAAPSPDHSRVAYIQLGTRLRAAACSTSSCTGNEPLLEFGNVRVRPTSAHSLAGFDDGTAINFLGADPRRAEQAGGPYTQRAFPYQLAFTQDTQLLFRPTWAPDGKKLAFSDGLSINVWSTAPGEAPVPIANTRDGVSPAWSPDGSRIAFTRLVRGDSTLLTCACVEGPGQTIPDIHNRWTYTLARSVITTIAPDGSALTELTDGGEPAWSPDGSTIYFTRNGHIMRIPRDGGAANDVPGTEGGRSPAVSPDGKWLAFTHGTVVHVPVPVPHDIVVDQNVWLIRLNNTP